MKTNIVAVTIINLVFLVSVKNVQAQCATPPSCESMGYTLDAAKGPGWDCTACPFNGKKWACSAKPCPYGSSVYKKGFLSWGINMDNTSKGFVRCTVSFSGDEPCWSNDKYDVTSNEFSQGGNDWIFNAAARICGAAFSPSETSDDE